MSTKINILNNKKFLTITFIILGILLLPVIEILVKIIFAYGKYIGTFARHIIEGKIC